MQKTTFRSCLTCILRKRRKAILTNYQYWKPSEFIWAEQITRLVLHPYCDFPYLTTETFWATSSLCSQLGAYAHFLGLYLCGGFECVGLCCVVQYSGAVLCGAVLCCAVLCCAVSSFSLLSSLLTDMRTLEKRVIFCRMSQVISRRSHSDWKMFPLIMFNTFICVLSDENMWIGVQKTILLYCTRVSLVTV